MKRNVVHIRVWPLVVLACLLCTLPLSAEEPKEEVKHTSTFNQQWLKTLVSIEIAEPNEPNKPEKKPKSIGSGFLVRTPGKHTALVTAKHVVYEKDENKKWKMRPNLAYRINRKGGTSDLFRETFFAKYSPDAWLKSEQYDVACRLMIYRSDSDIKEIRYSDLLTKPSIEPGAPLFIIGFPMGLRSEEYAMPIVRRGMVARTDSNSILADAFVFPGNSGGPVIYAPSTPLGKDFRTSVLQGQWLVGLVSNYISYIDSAISSRTGRARITFEENSGLCNVVPASAILELLESPEFVAADMKGAMNQSGQEGRGTSSR